MHQRLFLSAVVATLLLTALFPGLPALSASAGSVTLAPDVVYAADLQPAPTATPPMLDGSCHGGSYCGD